MRRVVVTGMGIVSSIGNDRHEVLESLRRGDSGIALQPEYVEMGLRSHVEGTINIDLESRIDRKARRFMGDAAAFNYVAMAEAIEAAGFEPDEIVSPRIGLITGSGGASTSRSTGAAWTSGPWPSKPLPRSAGASFSPPSNLAPWASR